MKMNLPKYLPWVCIFSLALSGCQLEDTDGDGIPDVYDTKDDRPGAGELNGVDYNGNQFVTPTPTPTASPGASPAPVVTPEVLLSPQSVTIPYNSPANLTVLARGNNLTYQWFQGAQGDITTRVGNDAPLLTTDSLTETTSYWVLVGNAGV